jgi:probable rRNA maturation factor
MRARAKSVEPVVSVSTRGGPFEGVSAAGMRRRAEKMLAHLGLKHVELSIGLVDNEAIHELNRSFRQKDKPTDVLAFPMLDALPRTPGRKAKRGEPQDRAPELGEVTGLLGDVIISIETARRQAEENSRPLLEELTMLLAHGLLHLLGYDHQTDAEERAMNEATRDLERAAAARGGATRAAEQAPKPTMPRKAGAGKQKQKPGAR